MILDAALDKAIIGYKVRHAGMKEGSYLDYNFKGFKIGGEDWFPNEIDEAADWEVIGHQIEDGKNWDIGAAVDRLDEDEPISIIKTGSFDG